MSDINLPKRNYGIELLRLVSMFMVCLLHVLDHGGVINNSTGLENYVFYLMKCICQCSVDVFAVTSGYVLYGLPENKINKRLSKLLSFWAQAFFYSLGISLVLTILYPNTIEMKVIIKSIVPFSSNAYWYVSSYFPIIIIWPWLNKYVDSFSRRELKRMLALVLLLYSCFYIFEFSDPVRLIGGHTHLWLIIMYILGASANRLGLSEQLSNRRCIQLFLICVLINWLWICCCPLRIFSLISYTSPTVIAMAFAMLFAFSNFHFSNRVCHYVCCLSPAAFGVYLVHDHSLLRNLFIKKIWLFCTDGG